MKKHFVIFAVLMVSFLTYAQENKAKSIKLTENEHQLVENNNRFALKLFSKVRESQLSTLNPQLFSLL